MINPIVSAILSDSTFDLEVTRLVEQIIYESSLVKDAVAEGVRSAASNTPDLQRLTDEVDRLRAALERTDAAQERILETLRTLGSVLKDRA